MSRRFLARRIVLLASITVAAVAPFGAGCGGPEEPGPADAGTRPDAGTDGGAPVDETAVECGNAMGERPATGACRFTRGSGATVLLQGNVLAPEGVLRTGQVLVGSDGRIACVSCDCSQTPGFAEASRIECPGSVISPGLVNAHDHITFTGAAPVGHEGVRFNHRHDWRKGKRGYPKLSVPSTGSAVSWGELRMVLGGATSLFGSGGSAGLVRNLDQSGNLQEGLGRRAARYETFPLGDSAGTLVANGCGYPSIDSPDDSAIAAADAYVPHVAEGIDAEANNEFSCLSTEGGGGHDLLLQKTAFIHGIGLTAANYAAMSSRGTALVWSPRSNIDLYGHTAEVTLAARLGVQIALGTDWTASGSMNVLRELKCADALNRNNYGGFFSDKQLHRMVTADAASVLGFGEVIGSLAAGRFADVAVFDGASRGSYRAVIDAEVKDVLLVLRGGKVLFGEAALVEGLGPDGCENLDVCGTVRKVCAARETGKTVAQLQAAAGSPYALFFCGEPDNEPSCIPWRKDEFDGQSVPDDRDGDGVLDAQDNCPAIFNAPRPLDGDKQPDADGDKAGDVCDPCPLDADSAECAPPPADDADRDGKRDAEDNCPSVPNADQADADADEKGDACDACPQHANAGAEPCAFTIYDIKQKPQSTAVKVADALVTAVGADGYFLQHVAGQPGYSDLLGADWSGIFVFTGGGEKPAPGDRVEVAGVVQDYYGRTQLSSATFKVHSSGNALPAPVAAAGAEVATGGARAKKLEGVLVQVSDVSVTEVAPAPGPGDRDPTNEFVVTGGLRVNDYLFKRDPLPAVGERFAVVRGVLRLANENSKLEPRSADDYVQRIGLRRFEPAHVSIATGTTNGATTPELRVVLDGPAPQAMDVALTSSDGRITPPATVRIEAGETSAAVLLTAGAAALQPVVLTASLDGVERTAEVLVFDPAAVRRLLAVEAAGPVDVGDSIAVTVRLDAPAGAGGARVALSVAPEGVVTLPAAELTVAEGQSAATLQATAVAAGTATIIASLNESQTGVEVTVLPVAADRAPGAGDLMITEVMLDPAQTADPTGEWFEVFNTTADRLRLDGLQIIDNAGNAKVSGTGLVLEPGAYAVFGCSANAVENGNVTPIWAYGRTIQLGNNGDRITLKMGTTEVDAVNFTSGSIAGRSLCLKAPYGDNSKAASWGKSLTTWSSGDYGSPGLANTADNCGTP